MAGSGILKLRKADPERLRSLGLNELWLQDRIAEDESLLGLGDNVHLFHREKIQPTGGRIDLVMEDSDTRTRYEVEVMLGATDESHIIRTIEYWDIERQKSPSVNHCAVIVAEEITGRFFNVIRLLNRAMPIMAIQLSAFRFGDEVILQFVRVLDTYGLLDDPNGDESEQVDSAWWQQRSNADSFKVIEMIQGLTPAVSGAQLTFRKSHIALGTSGYNFCWFHPKRTGSHCTIHVRVGEDARAELLQRLEEAGLDTGTYGSTTIRLRVAKGDVQHHRELLSEVLRLAEEGSRR